MAQDAVASILVVDDEPDVRELITECLKDEGFRVSTAGGVTQAQRKLKENRFDLVISDIRMPGESGIELLQYLRREYPETVVMIMTGIVDVPLAVHMIKLGALDYVTKPLDPPRLTRVVHACLLTIREQRQKSGH